MKVNQTKAIIACLGIAAAAAIAGSVSGTVAWFQYNTRTTAEFTGTTAKCTEFLQVRTVKKGVPVDFYEASMPGSGLVAGKTYFVPTEDKIYTPTSETEAGEGVAANHSLEYKAANNGKLYKYVTDAWAEDDEAYGEWGTSVNNAAILAAAGRNDNGLKPVTLPGATKNGALGTFYGQPVCGYELYDQNETYHWAVANAEDYMGFSLQFRVLDIDGNSTAEDPAMFAKSLYLTDITVADAADNPKEDITSALRVHIAGTSNALLAPGAGAGDPAVVSTTTNGALDLGGATGNDTEVDIPNNYSWSPTDPEHPRVLNYGAAGSVQAAYAMGSSANGLYPSNDGTGHLTGGSALGTTNENASGTAVNDNAYLTLDFHIFLEGWQVLNDGVHPASSLWDSDSYIGAKFNIGMSFGVDTIDEHA